MFTNEITENDDGQHLRRQGSIRKVLPSVPDADSPLGVSAKMIDRRATNAKNSYAPFFLEYSLMAEYDMLAKQRLPGVYVVPGANTPLKWYGVIFVHNGFYEEGVFHFALHIPEQYLSEVVPRLIFEPPVFHPLVNIDTGELDVSREFPKWRRNINFLWQILAFLRRSFYNIDVSNPVNSHAATLFRTDPELFKFKISESIRRHKDFLFDQSSLEDPHDVRFCNLKNQEFDELRNTMLTVQNIDASAAKQANAIGYSWVDPDTLEPFSEKKLIS